MNFGVASDIGKVRKINEDSFYVPTKQDKITLFAVADGIGGLKHGNLAAMMTIDGLVKSIYLNYDDTNTPEEVMKNAVRSVNEEIMKYSNTNEEFNGMGATLVALWLDEEMAYITHAGDSRCYLIREGFILQVTTDNSYVEYLLQKGAISIEEAKNHPQKNLITKAVGVESNIDTDMEKILTQSKDIFLLCSDGLTSMLSDEEIIHIVLNETGNMQKVSEKLVKCALEHGGKDNVTAILVEI